MTDRLTDAIKLACECHAGQTDKGGQPYILHCLRVMMPLDVEDARIAAVLHDTVEDTGLELSLIRQRFGPVVAEAVDCVTRRTGETYEAFIERCGVNDIARAVKWSDLRDNMDLSRLSNPTPEDDARVEKYRAACNRLTDIALERAPKD